MNEMPVVAPAIPEAEFVTTSTCTSPRALQHISLGVLHLLWRARYFWVFSKTIVWKKMPITRSLI